MTRLAGLLVLASLSGVSPSCNKITYDYERGEPPPLAFELTGSHPGWGFADCATCHDLTAEHAGDYTVDDCATCHGGNGAPQLDCCHTGYTLPDCETCHGGGGPHQSGFAHTTCGACHGTNGAPLRPINHFLDGCNDCHADGTASWQADSHRGYESESPQGCINCHR